MSENDTLENTKDDEGEKQKRKEKRCFSVYKGGVHGYQLYVTELGMDSEVVSIDSETPR